MRTVWQRDGGQCTFVSESGRRCEARRGLEYDHKTEFARGGEATVEGIQLRCHGHNQLTAEQTFGAGFMARKRREAAEARAAAKAARAKARAQREAESRLLPHEEEVIPCCASSVAASTSRASRRGAAGTWRRRRSRIA